MKVSIWVTPRGTRDIESIWALFLLTMNDTDAGSSGGSRGTPIYNTETPFTQRWDLTSPPNGNVQKSEFLFAKFKGTVSPKIKNRYFPSYL